MRIKYFYQQLASHLGVIVIAFIILSLLFASFARNFVYENKTEELMSYGSSILADLETGSNSRLVLQSYGHVLGGRDIQYSLFDENSKIIYSTGLKTPLIELDDAEWRELQNGKAITVKQEYKRFNQAVTFALLPYFHEGRFGGGVLLTSPLKGSRELISELNSYVLYAMGLALLASLLLSGLLSRLHGRRIKRLRDATAAVSEGDYSVRIPAPGTDEIGELAGDFNSMVAKLGASMDEIESLENRRRQFMADVSHELRTPLTTIRGILDGLRSDMISESEKERALGLASSETMRLIRLVNENLDYEKIRSNQVTLWKQDIDLRELLEIISEQLEDAAEERGDRIVVKVDDPVRVWADYDRLTQVLINITKNSIQFTENGTVWLRGKVEGSMTLIEIEDTGIGMDPGEVEKIWNRFYKAIDSRTTNPYGEFGLGLSIVKQLVQLHGGSISVESEKGRGTLFRIQLQSQPKEQAAREE